MIGWSEKVRDFQSDLMMISGERVEVKVGELAHSDLRFWTKNPRIYSIVHADTDPLDQDEIQQQLLEREHVKQLIQDIRHHGGLLNPVVVRDAHFEVLEGNSRLAAYRFLARREPGKYRSMKCMVFPSDIPEKLIYSYLNQEHIKGKSEWSPYEQAGVIYRLVESGIDLDELVKDLNVGKRVAQRMYDTYLFMVKHNEDNPSRWSYYEVYLKDRKVRERRLSNPSLDQRIVREIRSGGITAQEFREMLPAVCGSEKAFGSFSTGKTNLQGSFERLESEGKTEDLVKSLQRIHSRISTLRKDDFDKLNPKAAKTAEYEMKQIVRKLSSLREKVFGSDVKRKRD